MLRSAADRVSRRIQWVLVAAIIAALAVTGIVASAGAAQSRATAHDTALKQVPGTLPGVGLATLLRPAPSTEQIEVGVGISRPNPAGEQALTNEMYDSSSPLYHHFLSVTQFDAEFGVKPATTAAVRSFLTSGGLTITSSSSGGDYFLATGTVAQLDSLFKVTIGNYSYRGYRFTANNVAPTVPADLPIDAVAGLEDLTHFTIAATKGRQLAQVKSQTAAIATGRALLTAHTTRVRTAASGLPVTVSDEGTEQTYTPQDLWGFYNAPGANALTTSAGFSDPNTLENAKYTLGQGQIMGVFTEGEDSSVVRNLRLFETTLGLPKVPVRIVETEGTPDDAYSDNSGAEEWYLDSQASTGMAPDVKQLDLFTAKTSQDADVAKEFDYWANDVNGPREMNASFGECEENPTEPILGPLSNLPEGVALGGAMENLADPFLRQAVLEGRTLFASAGDTGSGCPTLVAPILGAGNGIAIQPVPFQEYPCISDYAVCVGGTTPSSTGAGYPAAAERSNEQAWTYSGGGSSYFNPAPSYQSGITNLDIHCISNDLGSTVYTPGTAPLCRGVPDVADMSGGGNDSFFFYTDGEPSVEGGTSLSSPLMMGQWARTQAAAAASTQSGGGLGFADPLIYKQASSADTCTTAPCTGTYARDFFDITQGENIGDVVGGQIGVSLPTGIGLSNGVYGPSAGWDYVSGWGSLNDENFIQDVDGTTNATEAYSGVERTAAAVCTATMSSPPSNATDALTNTDDPGLDITAATLTTQGSNIIATVTVPKLSDGLPVDAVGGGTFTVGWEYNDIFYYADAEESLGGAFKYEAGNTGAPFKDGLPVDGQYADTAAVSGSADKTTGQVTITVPASDVGTPVSGDALSDPQAFSQEKIATIDTTTDSADTLRGWSNDDGQADSVGVNVVMDGTPGSDCSNTLPATSIASAGTGVLSTASTPGTSRTKPRAPTTAVKQKSLTRAGLKLSGTAKAFDAHTITYVGVSIARAVKRKHAVECAFLTSAHKWTKAGSCAPRDYLKTKGTTKWTFRLAFRFTPGVYYVWEHAIDNKRLMTRNLAARHLFFRLR